MKHDTRIIRSRRRLHTVSYILHTILHAIDCEHEIPVWKMLQKNLEECRFEALQIQEYVGCGRIISTQSFSGGGALPNQSFRILGAPADFALDEKTFGACRHRVVPTWS